MGEPTEDDEDGHRADEDAATDLLIEEVSIDGLCGVY